MSDERDPLLETLFAEADRELDGGMFLAAVQARADALRRRRLAVVLVSCLAAAPALWLVGASLQQVLGALGELVSHPIADTESLLGAPMLSPLNSVGAAVALSLLALRALFKRLIA